MSLNIVNLPEWHDKAACKGANPEPFFPPVGHGKFATEAKAICATCTVIKDCFDYGMDQRMEYGVWGGTTVRDRKKLRRDM